MQYDDLYRIRVGTIADASSIARVHVDSWRSAYKGIVPDGFLNAMDYAGSEARQARLLSGEMAGVLCFVAEGPDDGIVGFTFGGPDRLNPDRGRGELYGIYVLEDYRGHGLGKRLVHRLARGLHDSGMASLRIWTLERGNAHSFYVSMGGRRADDAKVLGIGGIDLLEVCYEWDDIVGLLE